MQSVHHNKKHAGPLSESFLGDIPEDPEESLENIIANKIAPSGEDCLLMVGDIGDSRRQQRKLRRSNSDGNDIMSKAKSSILYNDMPAFDVSSHRPPLMHSQEPNASGNVQSKYRRSTNSTKPRSHSVSFTINPETNSGIWDHSEFNTTSNNVSLLESHQQVHQHAKYGRSYGSSYNGSVSLLAEPRYARKMHSYQQNGSVSFIKEPENNRSSSSADSFTEIENNIYTAFTRDASLKNAAMRNTFEKPRSASTRSRRNNSAPRNSRKVNAAQRSHDDIVSDGNFHVPRTSRKALAAQRSHDDTISEGNFHASRISRKPQRSHDDTVSEGNFHVSQVGQQREHCTTSEGNINVSHGQKHQSHGRISDNQIEAGQGRQRRSHKTQSTVSENNFDTGSHVSTQSSQSSQKSCGTGASGHNLDTTAFTEPLHINDLDHSLDSDGGSVRSVQSAYTDIGRLNTTDSRLAHRSRHTKQGYSDVGSVISAYGTDIADTRGRHHYIRRSGAGTSSGSHYGPVQSSHPGQLKLSVYVNYGLLTIHIGQAKKLSSRFGTPCSSFVQVSLEPDLEDRTQCKTSMVGDSNTPVYDEKFSFELIEEDHHKRVYIAVYNIDFDSGVNECLGSMSFSIKRILAAPEKLRGWFHLLPESRGHKHCMPVKDKRVPSQHAPPQHEQTLPLPPISAALRPNQSMVWMDSHVLTIQRSRHGYGFVVSGSSPVQVSQVHTDSEAMRSGLHKDDYITHINGLNVANSSADNVARIISGIQGTICIEVERPRTMSSLNMTTVSHKSLNPPSRTSHRKFAGFRIPFLPAKRESNKLNKTVTSATSHNTTLHQKLNKTLNLSFMSKSKRKSKSSNAVNKTMFECTEVVPSSDAASDISTVASSQLSSLNVSRSAEQLCGTMDGTMVNTTSVDTTINITTVDMTHSAANITTSMNKSFKRSLPWRKKKGIVKN